MSAPDWGLLEQLCAIHAVSGREDRMTAFVRDRIRPLVDEVRVDNLGNVVGILHGAQNPDHRLMLQSHMDELGLIVRNLTDDGFLLIERVGGIPEKSLLGQRVDLLTDDDRIVPGYVGTKSHHITSPDEKYKVPGVHDMFIDLGLADRPTDPVGQPGDRRRGSNASMLKGKPLPDLTSLGFAADAAPAAERRPPLGRRRRDPGSGSCAERRKPARGTRRHRSPGG